jgi:hypothetical protein
MGTYLTRRVTFDAAHRYWRADWSDDENRRVFGCWAARSRTISAAHQPDDADVRGR